MRSIETSEWQTRMIGIFRDQLPHWVAEYGRYAVTLRCRGSLPKEVLESLQQQAAHQRAVTPADEVAREEQRRIFLSLEHYLDQGIGHAPFRNASLALTFSRWLAEYHHNGLRFSEWVVMPNHLHLITQPLRSESCEHFRKTWIGFKKRSTRFLNGVAKRGGAFWQRSWFDRWIRDAGELAKWQRYLEQNPVKARLCLSPEAWPGASGYPT